MQNHKMGLFLERGERIDKDRVCNEEMGCRKRIFIRKVIHRAFCYCYC